MVKEVCLKKLAIDLGDELKEYIKNAGTWQKIGMNVFEVPQEIKEKNVFYVGQRMGFLTDKFYPSLLLLEKLSNYGPKLKVDKKRAWLFVCGRDLFLKQEQHGFPVGEIVFVFYEDIFLGIGKVEKKMIKNIADIGLYIRAPEKC